MVAASRPAEPLYRLGKFRGQVAETRNERVGNLTCSRRAPDKSPLWPPTLLISHVVPKSYSTPTSYDTLQCVTILYEIECL
jgi:hypothetical protein